jgi:hypothetical protein
MELLTRAFDVLCAKRSTDLKKQLGAIPELKRDTLRRARQVLRLLALFHDIGHYPFSHSGEIGKRHEDVSGDIVRSAFSDKIDRTFFKGCYNVVSAILCKDLPTNRQELTILQRLIKGEMDMDRTDYLLRDSHHCGVEYGRFDVARLIESLNLAKNDIGLLDVCIEEGGFHTVESLLLARYQMNLQVYFHRVRRIYDIYLAKFLEAWINEMKEITLQQFQKSDDIQVFEAIREHARNKKSSAYPWAKRLLEREHHREVFSPSEHADANDIIKVTDIFKRAPEEFPSWSFIMDPADKARGTVHNLFVSGDTDKIDDIKVLDERTRKGKTESIGEKSRIIQKIPKEFCVPRIFAAPNAGAIDSESNKKIIEKIRNWCKDNF